MREKLLDRMIKIYGMEDPIVVDFARLCETYPTGDFPDRCLEVLVEAHEAKPVYEY